VCGVLVEARGEADRVGELDAHRAHRAARHRRGEKAGNARGVQRQLVGVLFV